MHLAGLHLQTIDERGLEALVVASITIGYLLIQYILPGNLGKASREAGPVISRTPAVAQCAVWIHGTAIMAPPIAYVLGVGFNGFAQPTWMQESSLPDEWALRLGVTGYIVVRVIAALCIATVLPGCVMVCRNTLGSQYALIGVRKRAVIVSSGPYAYVRHPLYTTFSLAQPFLAAALWSWIPFYALAFMTASVVVKVHHEEKLILSRPDVGAAYTNYQKNVSCRFFPLIW